MELDSPRSSSSWESCSYNAVILQSAISPQPLAPAERAGLLPVKACFAEVFGFRIPLFPVKIKIPLNNNELHDSSLLLFKSRNSYTSKRHLLSVTDFFYVMPCPEYRALFYFSFSCMSGAPLTERRHSDFEYQFRPSSSGPADTGSFLLNDCKLHSCISVRPVGSFGFTILI